MYRWFKGSILYLLAAILLYALLIRNADQGVALWLTDHPINSHVQSFAALIAHIFHTEYWLVAALVIFIGCHIWTAIIDKRWSKMRAGIAYVAATVSASLIITGALKVILGRARPIMWLSDKVYGFHPFSFHHNFQGSPSGHTTAAWALAMSVCLLSSSWPLRIIACVLALIVTLSRLVLLQHYCSDVVLAMAIAIWVAFYLKAHYHNRLLKLSHHDEGDEE